MMPIALLATTLLVGQIYYIVPLLAVVSLVYGATRHEEPQQIVQHALSTAMWMFVFLGVVFVVVMLLSWWA